METLYFDHDIPVFYVTASSFPEGIMDAHAHILALAPAATNRRFFSLSRPENGGSIVYKAAAEELFPNESQQLNCETLSIKKGNYICETVYNYPDNIISISKTFDKLLKHPDLDPQGYCVEWYVNDTDVKCMVRLR